MKDVQYAKVSILDAPRFLDKGYDYVVPEEWVGKIKRGSFVTVPFGGGNRRRTGLVESLSSVSDYSEAKPLYALSTPRISLSEEMLGLVSFLRETTLCTTGDAVHAMIPSGAFSAWTPTYYPTNRDVKDVRALTPEEAFLLAHLREGNGVSLDALKHRFGAATEESLAKLVKAGLAVREFVAKDAMAHKETAYYALAKKDEAEKTPRLGEKQRAVLECLEAGERTDAELRALGFSKQTLDSLLEKGLLTCRAERVWRNSYAEYGKDTLPRDFELNEEQAGVFSELCTLLEDGKPHGVLLHGVTGSGKTPVMLKTIDRVLASGKGVIVLLPEIALTPQTLSLFCSRYGERVAVMHSALSAGERMDAYFRVLEGEADVVVGTRSAVFAPVKNLGLIVMDEEHEHTYKSDMNPKYHARDIARYRAAKHGATLLLCSATPSLESYKRAVEGRYTLLKLRHRHAGATLPEVQVADMRLEPNKGNLSPIGEKLKDMLISNMESGNQSVLFLNRRGYHHAVSCRACGEALVCPACSVSLKYHTKNRQYSDGYLLCHTCGRRQPMPKACPSCGSEHLSRIGYGTQRVEEELEKLLPTAKVLRMDTDTTTARFSYDEMLGAFRRHEADVLLGTQMVTKGHDFPDVTLVGVLMADAALYLDDYRASERTFSMLTQVIGRAGRAGKKGVALIQTVNPDHEVIELACRQDYETFYEREIRLRKLLVFPPFCDIALLTLSHTDERKLLPAAKALSEELAKLVCSDYSDVKIVAYGPFEAPVYRADGKYRMRMVVKCALNPRTRAMFSELLDIFGKQKMETPLLSVDFNPSSL